MNKQFLRFSMFVSVFFMSVSLLSQDIVLEPVVEQDNSGQERIVSIMSKIKHDVVPGKVDPILYAKTTNVDKDLNLQAIVDVLAPKTVMGKSYLHELLQHPVSPGDESGVVQLRQDIIRKLVENPSLKAKIESLLQAAAQEEEDVITLMSNSFKNKTCPEIEGLKKLKEQGHFLYGYCNFMLTNRIQKTFDFISNTVTLPLLWLGTGSLGYAAFDNEFRNKALPQYNSAQCAGYFVYAGLLTALTTYGYYDGLVKAGEKRSKMHALNQIIHIAENLEKLSGQNKIESQFKMSLIVDNDGLSLIDGLKAIRYESKIDYCFDVSAVHTFLYKVYQNEDQLAQIFASIAEMDAYNAIATKMIEAQNSSRQFCFAQKLELAQPKVVSKDFWNLLVPNAVINSLFQDQHIILTGPNAGGKTTSIRAILQNIVLAQTFGVAAASHFEYTPFDTLLSYLNISDDLLHGLSLFASEVKRAQELLEIIKALPVEHKLFFALDELFTGTAAEAGEKIAFDFIKKTAGYKQTLFIYATHFDALKELGKQDCGLMNYQVNAPTKNRDGKLVYPFTLSPGASTVNVAMDMAREANLFE